MKKKQFKKLMRKLESIQATMGWIENRMPPPKPVEFKPYKPLTMSLTEEWADRKGKDDKHE